MQKKLLLQFFLFTIILIMIFFFYKIYFADKELDISVETNSDQKISKNKKNSNIIYNIEYVAEDNDGNNYIVKSKYGELKNDQSNLIILKKVLATINIQNSPSIEIASDGANYNSINYDTEFYGNVTLTYVDHIITSDNLDLYFQKNLAYFSDNVVYKNLNNSIQADKIEIDLITKNSKIYMNNTFKKIKVTSKR
mgnify:FL=1